MLAQGYMTVLYIQDNPCRKMGIYSIFKKGTSRVAHSGSVPLIHAYSRNQVLQDWIHSTAV
jgi:hypothetical protein